MMALGALTVLIEANKFPQASQNLFHIFHPLHILFSATATTAMFWRHDKKILKAVFIGFVGAVSLCGISDIFIPFVAGHLLSVKMHLHICILADPMIVLPFLFFGIFMGFVLPTVASCSPCSNKQYGLYFLSGFIWVNGVDSSWWDGVHLYGFGSYDSLLYQ
jgi:hypothetical protein